MNETKTFIQQATTKEVATFLVGMYLEYQTEQQTLGGWIVDCEAYLGADDQAAHSYRLKKTPRLAAMYQEAGTIYLYQMHTQLILNIVTQDCHQPQGVMIRALEPDEKSIAQMEKNRRGKTGVDLTNGPGKLIQALGVSKDLYGQSIFTSSLHLRPDKRRYPQKIATLPRIGIPNKGFWSTAPLRFVCQGNPYLTQQKKSQVTADFGWKVGK